jgi:hypothetical protein
MSKTSKPTTDKAHESKNKITIDRLDSGLYRVIVGGHAFLLSKADSVLGLLAVALTEWLK